MSPLEACPMRATSARVPELVLTAKKLICLRWKNGRQNSSQSVCAVPAQASEPALAGWLEVAT